MAVSLQGASVSAHAWVLACVALLPDLMYEHTLFSACGVTPAQTWAGVDAGPHRFWALSCLQVYGMDQRLMDPRRPRRTSLTAEQQEERLILYQDTLPINPLGFSTYDRQVRRKCWVSTPPGVRKAGGCWGRRVQRVR